MEVIRTSEMRVQITLDENEEENLFQLLEDPDNWGRKERGMLMDFLAELRYELEARDIFDYNGHLRAAFLQ